jgi:hypothetical protein
MALGLAGRACGQGAAAPPCHAAAPATLPAVSDPRTSEIVAGLADAAPTEADREASRVMVHALRAHKDRVGGIAHVPETDPQLSSKILNEAQQRSRQIISQRQTPVERPIPWWLWLAWIAAIAGVALAWWKLA